MATREDAAGVRTSSLRFWSDDPKSLIRVGSGYWQYIPAHDGVRFLTRYQYETRFGPPGRLFNTAVFEPLLGWATAWSFDRLRLWLEHGVDPGAALDRSVVHTLVRVVLALIWPYQGLGLNLAMAGLSVIGYLTSRGLPSAAHCLRQPRPSQRT